MANSEEIIKNLILNYVKNEHYVHNNTIDVYWDYRDCIEDMDSLKEVCDIGVSNDVETFDDAMLDYMYQYGWDLDHWRYIFENLDFNECVETALENGEISDEDFEYYQSLDFSDIRDIIQDNIVLDMNPDHFNCDVVITLSFAGQYSENYLDRVISGSNDDEDFYTFDEYGGLDYTDIYYVIIQADAYKFYEIYKQYKTDGKSLTDEIILTNCDIAIGDEDNIAASNKTIFLNKRMIRQLDDISAEFT